jgi:hypothetical protein
MIYFGRPHDCPLEGEVQFRDDTVMCEVSKIYELEEWDEEGYYFPVSYLYEFKLYGYSELTQNYEIPLTEECTDQENRDLQKYIDEWAADDAAARAEDRYY